MDSKQHRYSSCRIGSMNSNDAIQGLRDAIAKANSAITRLDFAKDWDEAKHPRGAGGRFGDGSESSLVERSRALAAKPVDLTGSGFEAKKSAMVEHYKTGDAWYAQAAKHAEAGEFKSADQAMGVANLHYMQGSNLLVTGKNGQGLMDDTNATLDAYQRSRKPGVDQGTEVGVANLRDGMGFGTVEEEEKKRAEGAAAYQALLDEQARRYGLKAAKSSSSGLWLE